MAKPTLREDLLLLESKQPCFDEQATSKTKAGRHSITRYGIKDAAQYIRETREITGLSQEDFARALGVSAQAVYFWENRKRTPPPLAVEWCITLRTVLEHAKSSPFANEADWNSVLAMCGLSAVIGGLLAGLSSIGLSGLRKFENSRNKN